MPKATEPLKIVGGTYLLKNVRCPDLGQCSTATNTITLGDDLPKHMRFDTLWHEVVHAIDHELQLKLKHKDVYRIASAVSQALRDNPVLRRP